jgi:hypothetical protein
MKIVAGITIVLLLALLGARWTFTRVRLPLAARQVYLTGTEYILIGVCLGGLLLGLLDDQTLRGLAPLLYLALGWIGLMYGSQLELRRVLYFPRQYLLVALVQGVVTLGVCLLPLLLLQRWLPLPALPAGAGAGTLQALALAAVAVPTAQSSLALIEAELELRPTPVMQLLRYVAGIDAVIGLTVFGFLFGVVHPQSPIGVHQLVPLQVFVVSVVLGLAMGVVLHVLTRVQCSQGELLLFTVGVVVFSAGAAAFLRLSPLFVTLVGGILIANLRSQHERIARVLVSLEKPLYLVVLLWAGARIRGVPGLGATLLLALGYIGLRGAGKLSGGALASLLFRSPERLPASLGLGLVSQGGIAAAMVVSFHQAFSGPAADVILLVVLVAVIVNELWSPALARRVIRNGVRS